MTQHDGGWSQDKDTELVTLEQLYEQLNTMHTAGVAQEYAQIHALQAIESERRIVEDALRDLDMEEDNGTQEYVVRPIDEASKYAVPHLSHEQIQAIPLLRTHAEERRRMRALLSTPPWSARDIECLQTSVQNESLRQNTLYGTPEAKDWSRISAMPRSIKFQEP